MDPKTKSARRKFARYTNGGNRALPVHRRISVVQASGQHGDVGSRVWVVRCECGWKGEAPTRGGAEREYSAHYQAEKAKAPQP